MATPTRRPTTTTPPAQLATTIATAGMHISTPQRVVSSTTSSTLESAAPKTTESKGFFIQVYLFFKNVTTTAWNTISKALNSIKSLFVKTKKTSSSAPQITLQPSIRPTPPAPLPPVVRPTPPSAQNPLPPVRPTPHPVPTPQPPVRHPVRTSLPPVRHPIPPAQNSQPPLRPATSPVQAPPAPMRAETPPTQNAELDKGTSLKDIFRDFGARLHAPGFIRMLKDSPEEARALVVGMAYQKTDPVVLNYLKASMWQIHCKDIGIEPSPEHPYLDWADRILQEEDQATDILAYQSLFRRAINAIIYSKRAEEIFLPIQLAAEADAELLDDFDLEDKEQPISDSLST